MDNDTTSTSGTQQAPEALAPRRILALIALEVDLPAPRGITFIPRGSAFNDTTTSIMSLSMATLGDASRWATWLGATMTKTSVTHNGQIFFDHSTISWHGWHVSIGASEPTMPDGVLDSDTRDRLEQVADVTPTGGP